MVRGRCIVTSGSASGFLPRARVAASNSCAASRRNLGRATKDARHPRLSSPIPSPSISISPALCPVGPTHCRQTMQRRGYFGGSPASRGTTPNYCPQGVCVERSDRFLGRNCMRQPRKAFGVAAYPSGKTGPLKQEPHRGPDCPTERPAERSRGAGISPTSDLPTQARGALAWASRLPRTISRHASCVADIAAKL